MSTTAPSRERFWFIPHVMVVLAIVCVAGPIVLIGWAVASTSVGPISVADGGLLFWRDYPGVASLDPDEVLDADRAETVDADFAAITAEIDAAIVAELGGQWNAADQQRIWSGESNGYSGSSMLSTVTATSYAVGAEAAEQAERDRAIEIIRRVAGAHGFTGWSVDAHSAGWEPSAFQGADGVVRDSESRWVEGSMTTADGRTLFVRLDDWRTTDSSALTDASAATTALPVDDASAAPSEAPSSTADPSVGGSVDEMHGAGGKTPSSISLTLTATHLLPDGADGEFESRLAPFEGLDRPRGGDEA